MPRRATQKTGPAAFVLLAAVVASPAAAQPRTQPTVPAKSGESPAAPSAAAGSPAPAKPPAVPSPAVPSAAAGSPAPAKPPAVPSPAVPSSAGGLPAPAKPPEAQPSPEEVAAARDLWKIGLELEKAKDWAGALDTFMKVGQVRMTPQVRYHIAFSSEHLGKFVDALNAYQLAMQEARAMPDKARDVLEQTPARIEQLRARLAKLRVHVDGKIRTSVLTLDGKKLSLALLDHDIPVDPGKHVVEIRRGTTVVARETVEFPEGHTETLEFRVDDPLPPRTGKSGGADGFVEPEAGPTGTTPDSGTTSRLPAYLTAGAGAVALVGGGVFLGLRQWSIDQVRASCRNGDTGCDPALAPTAEQGRTYSTLGTVLAGVGGAAVATGVVLWFVLEPEEGEVGAPAPSVGVAPTPGGLAIHGRF